MLALVSVPSPTRASPPRLVRCTHLLDEPTEPQRPQPPDGESLELPELPADLLTPPTSLTGQLGEEPSKPVETRPRVVVLMDRSSSMCHPEKGCAHVDGDELRTKTYADTRSDAGEWARDWGDSRWREARDALLELVDKHSATTSFSFGFFPAATPARAYWATCDNPVELIELPSGSTGARDAIGARRPVARQRTPLWGALAGGVARAMSEGASALILVTDGKDSCGDRPPPSAGATDGAADAGLSPDWRTLALQAVRRAAPSLKTYAVGLGSDFDHDALREIGSEGDTCDQGRCLFRAADRRDELSRILATIVDKAKADHTQKQQQWQREHAWWDEARKLVQTSEPGVTLKAEDSVASDVLAKIDTLIDKERELKGSLKAWSAKTKDSLPFALDSFDKLVVQRADESDKRLKAALDYTKARARWEADKNAHHDALVEHEKALAAWERSHVEWERFRARVAELRAEDPGRDTVAVAGPAGWRCSGVVVGPRAVLTARHCLPATAVLVGASVRDPTAVHRVVEARTPDEPGTDVALLLLGEQVELSARRGGLWLRREAGDDAPPVGLVRLIGFGAVDVSGRHGFGEKHFVESATSGWGCDTARARSSGCGPGLEMIVDGSGGRDTCDGDSGGPAFERVEPPGEDCSWRLLAITSRPVANAKVRCGAGGIYVRVDRISSWLEEQLASSTRRR